MVFLQKVSGRNWIFASEPINRIRSGKNRNFTFTEIREITIRHKNTPFYFHITTEAGSRGRKEREPLRTFKETSKIVEEVANIALQAAEEKGLTFREVLYLPEMIDARIKKEIEKREEPFRRTPQQ